MDDYGVTEAELQEINDEFEEKERKGDAVDEEAERKALSEIKKPVCVARIHFRARARDIFEFFLFRVM